MRNRIKPILIKPSGTIREAMAAIELSPHSKPEPGPAGIALVTDRRHKLLGILTDGDIRKAILGGVAIDSSVSGIMKKNPVTVKKGLSAFEMMRAIIREIKERNIVDHKLDKIVVVDDDNGVHDVLSFFELWKNTEIHARNVYIVGLGYVGLTLALTLCEVGFKVHGIDTDKKVAASLRRGRPHFHEVGLEPLLKHHINKNFFVQSDFKNGESDIYIIAVNTPVNEKGEVVFDYLKKAITSVAKILKPHDLIILRSTVSVGTCRKFAIPLIEKISKLKAGEDFYLSFAPERTVEGRALEELRILPQVIGGINEASVDLTTRLFKTINHLIVPVQNLEAAEVVKLLNNSFRDVSFAYANEVAQACEKFGVNAFEVIEAANRGYPRNKIPSPSPGVGGLCLVKDPWILVNSAKQVGFNAKLPALGRKINEEMIKLVAKKVSAFAVKNKIKPNALKIFVLGVAFKGEPETSDMRFSPAVDIIKELQQKFKNIVVYDPVIKTSELKKARLSDGQTGLKPVSLADGFEESNCVLVLNNHHSFRDLDIYDLLMKMKKPGYFFDGWNLFPREAIEGVKGIKYGTFGV
ncbi:MAG: hypothetical protein A3G03_00380 [Candidatus Taylorbacteria bacterium RIFCSPLOWO2_12_FULL_44_15c]|uniref:CBS domain-containing protein n=1 Tax=Candidatus Taylorbacteria bacterium RIFCSPLOWO2_12_FULL_44_15c TaxID=1802333 RepID=A0A1G2P712_9BACT|nr:MAG: hypothetical protein A3G03_00380 [Candidatus Taylorbacteria bacterium RIFCSPLOWO2_12_FULL_44_15c]